MEQVTGGPEHYIKRIFIISTIHSALVGCASKEGRDGSAR